MLGSQPSSYADTAVWDMTVQARSYSPSFRRNVLSPADSSEKRVSSVTWDSTFNKYS